MMERLIHSRHKRLLNSMLIGAAAIYGLTNSTHANAVEPQYIAPDLEAELCMADAYMEVNGLNSLPKDSLNCTANDVEITKIEQESIKYCNPGDVVEFYADITVRTNANERYDTTFYNSLSGQSPQFVQVDKDEPINMPGGGTTDYPYYCSILLPLASEAFGEAYMDLDGDVCGDITKANGVDNYTLPQQKITMLCEDVINNDNKADFRYCAAWDNTDDNVCTTEYDPVPGQVPNTKSKCNCDILTTNIFIQPDPPTIEKEFVPQDVSNSVPEPGGAFTFHLEILNNNENSIFVTSVYDHIDVAANGTYAEVGIDKSFNLWGDVYDGIINENTADGVYLLATSCQKPDEGKNSVEVVAGDAYGCNFTVHIVDRTLSADQLPVLYNDVVALTFVDEFGNAVTNGETCPNGLTFEETGVKGRFCSSPKQVEITNLQPAITVTKTATMYDAETDTYKVIDEILEPGADVRFVVEILNSAGADELWDSPLTLKSLSDSVFAGILGNGADDCKLGVTIAANDKYTCTFTAHVSGDAGDVHTNTVTAVATDDENDDTPEAKGTETLDILDVPSIIDLVKTAGGAADGETYKVPETGDTNSSEDVTYKFEFSVDEETVEGDYVVFNKLIDVIENQETNLTSQCIVDGTPLANGITLYPGESAYCEIVLSVQGDAGDTIINMATIYGYDSDDVDKQATDDATVLFENVDLLVTPEVAMKARVFVRLPNTGVDDVTITEMILGNGSAVDPDTNEPNPRKLVVGSYETYDILDEAAIQLFGNFGEIVEQPATLDGPYDFCTIGTIIKPNETYECGFTIKFYPGFTTGVTDISQLFTGLDSLVITLDDGDGTDESVKEYQVQLLFETVEP